MFLFRLSEGKGEAEQHRHRPVDPVLATKYIQNSLAVDSDEMRTIQACAAENGIVVALGFSENDHNSVYIAQAIIDADGKLLTARRKLKPTHMERTIFGDASGNSLINVADTKLGKRVGSLACWEHCQPLLKYHTATQREDIHSAGWPPLAPHAGPELWSMSMEGEQPTFISSIFHLSIRAIFGPESPLRSSRFVYSRPRPC